MLDSIEDLYIKLSDFGFATYFKAEESFNDQLGSPLYMPPEIVTNQKYCAKVDIWSAGVVIYTLLCGHPPFNGRSKDDVYKSITNDPLKFNSKQWNTVS